MATEIQKRSSSATPNSTYEAEGYDYLWQPPPWSISDPGEQIVEGYASLPNLDDQGDVIPLDVIDAAMPSFMQWGNLREMHQQSAVGKVIAAKVDEHGLYIIAKVEDPRAWAKVRSGVYQGFSVGGNIPEDATEQRADGARIIKEVMLSEISLVDRPANPKARIGVVKLQKDFSGKTHKRKCEKHKKEGCEECGCDRTVGHPNTGASSGMADRPEEAEKVAQREDANPKEGKKKYGDVRFADPKNKKYPIDTEEHVRAALSYWGMPKNRAKYSSEDQKTIGAKIHAAAKRLGIGGNKTTKGTDIMDLQKIKETLADPAEIEALEKAEQIIAKASGSEWHSQRDVGNPKDEAESGVELEDNDVEGTQVEDFIKGKEADGESSGESEGKRKNQSNDGDDDDVSKASGDGMSHLNACYKSLQSAQGAFDGDHPAKAHVSTAMGHLSSAKKCFGKSTKASEAGDLRKSLGTDVEIRIAELEEGVEFLARKLSNTTEYLVNKMAGLPRSRPLPPVTRDDESRAARLALNGNQ